MKTISTICRITVGLSLSALPLSAQNYEATDSPPQTFVAAEEIAGARQSEPTAGPAGSPYLFQGPGTLDARKQISGEQQRSADSGILRISHRKVASGSEDVLSESLALLSASYRENAKTEESGKCDEVSMALTSRINQNPSTMLEIVEAETSANPSCACEIVKAAIQTTDGETAQVIAIVETAITTAPEHLRLIAQCAIAASPESLSGVQALLAKLDPNAGGSGRSAKSAKNAVARIDSAQLKTPEEAAPNPLDLPPFYFSGAPIIIPSPITNVNP
jgi:hypothetical protein